LRLSRNARNDYHQHTPVSWSYTMAVNYNKSVWPKPCALHLTRNWYHVTRSSVLLQ